MRERSEGFQWSSFDSKSRLGEFCDFPGARSSHEDCPPDHHRRRIGRDGFTLIDLLAVIATMAVMASLLLPALAKGGPSGQGLQCMNNLKQLTVAWSMYANDNNDRLVGAQGQIAGLPNWMTGSLDFNAANLSNWDTNRDVIRSPLWSYVGQQASLLRCPADQSTVVPSSGPYIGQHVPRVRSVSMSQVFGTGDWLNGFYGPGQTVWRTYHKGADIVIPSKTFLFADEHPNSINDASLAVACTGADSPSNARIIDFPANYHNGAGVFALSDGHTEMHNWIGSKLRDAPINFTSYNNFYLNVLADDSWVDVQWLAEHTTVRR